ncbi:hypothetical protein P7K49_009274 [Saguinus oedipus]|uniref:Kazal-like domain-containing protein n=1 Tax=Saguinus oedipus TaxID=9490 RepID=A0ABQ9VJH2_SAGOE|nr:hypothetical protein P7K49_009274 [Saguinus oedipus]
MRVRVTQALASLEGHETKACAQAFAARACILSRVWCVGWNTEMSEAGHLPLQQATPALEPKADAPLPSELPTIPPDMCIQKKPRCTSDTNYRNDFSNDCVNVTTAKSSQGPMGAGDDCAMFGRSHEASREWKRAVKSKIVLLISPSCKLIME